MQVASLWWQKRHAGPPPSCEPGSLRRSLALDIARLDAKINAQLNAILHHPRFQALEASWRGLKYLTDGLPDGHQVRLRALNLSWSELTRDCARAIEFDQSQLFRKIYSEEFDLSGGEPYGVLLADYEIREQPADDYPYNDISTLGTLSHIAAAAFAPLIIGVHPTLFGIDRFANLEMPIDLADSFRGPRHTAWQSLRDSEDSRFLGLVLPRVLRRRPYHDDCRRADGFGFREDAGGESADRYLWGTAVYALGSVVARCFAQSGWMADIRGVRLPAEEAGLVTGLATDSFATDRYGLIPKYPTDVLITDNQERELSELGFIPLCVCRGTPWAAFYSNASMQRSQTYTHDAANQNARISTSLQYLLCASRFSHYIKIMMRDKIGSLVTAERCQDYLQSWLHSYTVGNDDASHEMRMKYPLREARVEVREQLDKPGHFFCVMHLRPHLQLDHLASSIRLVTQVASVQPT